MNRVAFKVFKRKGPKAKFEDFLGMLTVLQEGSFDRRVKCWLNLVYEVEQFSRNNFDKDREPLNIAINQITREQFSNVIRAAYP